MKMPDRLGVIAFWMTWPGSWLLLRTSKRPRVAIQYQDELLVVKPWLGTGKWTLPGGGMHKSESAESAARREVREEVGIELSATKLKLVDEIRFHQSGLSFDFPLFHVQLTAKPAIRPQKGEIVAAAWVKIEELRTMPINQDVAHALETL